MLMPIAPKYINRVAITSVWIKRGYANSGIYYAKNSSTGFGAGDPNQNDPYQFRIS
jgi:hypothetical protein